MTDIKCLNHTEKPVQNALLVYSLHAGEFPFANTQAALIIL